MRCELCNERTDGIGLCYNPGCDNYRGKRIVAEPSIESKVTPRMTRQAPIQFLETITGLSPSAQYEAIGLYMQEQAERIERAETNVRHWREECGKLHAQVKVANEDGQKMQAMYHEAVEAASVLREEVNRIDRQAKQFSEEVSSCFKKYGLAAGPTALDRVMQQLEEARQARDVAEAKGRWLDSIKVCQTVRELAAALPPDVLMHPMPFPDRLDYAGKLIQTAFDKWFCEQSKA